MENGEKSIREAGEVFLFMHRIFRASRNLRAYWYIDHLGKAVSIQKVPQTNSDVYLQDDPPDEEDEYTPEMTVVGIIPKGGDGTEIIGTEQFLVTTDTKCTYISRYYRIVYVLDISPSIIVADDESNCVLVDRVLPILKNALNSSVKSFIIPGTTNLFTPQVFCSIGIFSPFLKFEDNFTLCQGVLITESNVEDVLKTVCTKFNKILSRLFTNSRSILELWGKLRRRHKHNKFDSLCESDSISDENLRRIASCDPVETKKPEEEDDFDDDFENIPMVEEKEVRSDMSIMDIKKGVWAQTEKQEETNQFSFASDQSYVAPNWSLIFMLRMGLLHIQMLPENTQSNLVVISDSVCGMPDEAALQKVLTQLRSYTVAFSFIQLQKKACTEPVFGHVGSSQLFHFISLATFGTYLPRHKPGPPKPALCFRRSDEGNLIVTRNADRDEIIEPCTDNINIFHRALICWSFQNALEENYYLLDTFEQINKDFLELQISHVDRHRKFAATYEATLNRMMYVRLREGFTLKSTVFVQNKTRVILTLRLAFRPLVFIDYIITANWPASRNEQQIINIELVLEGPYNELKDLLTQSNYLNPVRMNLIKSVIDGIIDADRQLLHVHSFDTNPAYYTIPAGVNVEHALFQHGGNDLKILPQLCIVRPDGLNTRGFVNFWRKMLEVNDNNWQKWVHTQTERGLLNLIHVPFDMFTTDKVLSFDIRYPRNAVLYCVKVRASFCLVENVSYVSLIYENQDSTKPIYFFLRKVTCHGPVVTIKTAFLGGVSSRERRIAVSCLRQRLTNVTYGTILNEEDLIKEARRFRLEAHGEKQYMEPKQIFKKRFEPACTVFRRPLERMIVRYTHVPLDLTTIMRSEELTNDEGEIMLLTLHNTLCKTLTCRRHIVFLNPFGIGGAFSVRFLADFCQNVIMFKRMNYENYRPAWTLNNAVSVIRQVYDSSGTSLEQFIMFPSIAVEPNFLGNPVLKREVEDEIKYEKNAMPSKNAFDSLAIVSEQWNEPEGGNPDDQLRNISAEERLGQDLRFISVLYTIDTILRYSGECDEARIQSRLKDTNFTEGKMFPYQDRARCSSVYELTGIVKKVPPTEEEQARFMNTKSKSRKRAEKLKTEAEKKEEKENMLLGPPEIPKTAGDHGKLPVRYKEKVSEKKEEDLLEELDDEFERPDPLRRGGTTRKRQKLTPTVTDIHADQMSKFVTSYSNLFSLINVIFHAERKYLPIHNFVLEKKDSDISRCNQLQLNALHCQLSEVCDLTWPVDVTEKDVIWADLMKTLRKEDQPPQTDLRVYVKALTVRMVAFTFVPVTATFDPQSKLVPVFLLTVHEAQIAHCFAQDAFDKNNIVSLRMKDIQNQWDSAARFGWTPNNRNVFPEDISTFTSFVRYFEDELLPRIRMRSMYEAAMESIEMNENSLLDMAGEVECLELEMPVIPRALQKVCKHLNNDLDTPPGGEVCCQGSNISHMFNKMVNKHFVKVHGTENTFYLNAESLVEPVPVKKIVKRRRTRTRGSSGMMYVDSEDFLDSTDVEESSMSDPESEYESESEIDKSSGSSRSSTSSSSAKETPPRAPSGSSESSESTDISLTQPPKNPINQHKGEDYVEYSGTSQPMFLQFNCTVNYKDDVTSFPINFLPTCIHSVLQKHPNPPTDPEEVKEVSVAVELVVLTTQNAKPAMGIQQTTNRLLKMARSRLRNPYEYERERRESYKREVEELEEDEVERDDDEKKINLYSLPKSERRVITDIIKNVGVILELEKILTYSRKPKISVRLLSNVIKYIETAVQASGKMGHADKLFKPFLLVDNSPAKIKKFMKLVANRECGYVKLTRFDDTMYFYSRSIHNEDLYQKMKQEKSGKEEPDDGREGCLPDFWIIITIDQKSQSISVHSCQRFADQHTAVLEKLWSDIRQELKVINQESLLESMYVRRECDKLMVPDFKKMTQYTAADGTKRTRYPSSLGSPRGSPMRKWMPPGTVVPKEEGKFQYELYYYFREGYFACPLQKELWIPVPERVRDQSSRLYRNPLKIGFETMKKALISYSIDNRDNTFVYKDTNSNQIIYFQLHMDIDHYMFSVGTNKTNLRKKQMETVEKMLQTKVCITIFGISEPSKEFCQMLWENLTEKIDAILLSDIMRGYEMNSEQCLMTNEVAFLQPPEIPPKFRSFFSIPSIFNEFLSSLLFYIGQQLEILPSISPAKVKDHGVFYNGAAFMKTPVVDQWQAKKKLTIKDPASGNGEEIDEGIEAKEELMEIFPVEEVKVDELSVRPPSSYFRSHEPIVGELPENYSLSSFFVYHVLPAVGVVSSGIALLEFRFVKPDGRLITSYDQPSMNEQSHNTLVPNVLDDKATVYKDIIKSQLVDAPKSPPEKTLCGYLEVIVWSRGDVDRAHIEKIMHELIEMSMFDIITEFGYLNTTIVEEGALTGTLAFRNSEVFLPESAHSEPRQMLKQGSASSVTASVDTRHQTGHTGHSNSGEIRRSLAHGGSLDISLHPTNSKTTIGRMPSIVKDIEHSIAREEIRSKRSSLRQDYINRKNAYSIIKWLDFVASKQGETNSVVKHRIRFEFQHASLPALFEIRNRLEVSLGGLHESEIRERVYLCGLRKPAESENHNGVNLRESTLSIFGTGSHEMRFEVLTTDPFHAMTEDCGVDESQNQEEYLIVSCIRNVFEGYGENMIRPRTQVEEMKQMFRNHLHGKYNPLVQTHMYSPRQRIMIAHLVGDFMTLYFYNYHKNIHTEAVDCANKIVGFHNAKSRLLREIGLHKMGITHLSPFHTEPIHEYDYEVLIWTDPTSLISKEFPGEHKIPPSYVREPQCSNIFFRMYRQPDLQETMGRTKTLFRSECVKTMHFEQMLRWRSGLKSRIDFIRKITKAHFEMTKKNTSILEQDLLLFLRPPKVARKLGPPPTQTSSASSIRHRFHYDDDNHTEDNASMTERTSKRASVYGESLKSQAIAESEIFKGKGEFVKKTEFKLGLAASKFHEIRTPLFLRSDWNTNIPRRTGEIFDEVVRQSDIKLLLEDSLKEFQSIYEVQKAKANKQLMKRKYSEKNVEVVVSDVTVKNVPGTDDDGNEVPEKEEETWTEDDSDVEEDARSEAEAAANNFEGESSRSNSESKGVPQLIGDENFERTYGKVRRAWKPNPPASPAPLDSRHNSISNAVPVSRTADSGPIEKMFSFTLNAATKITRRLSRRPLEKEPSIEKGEEAFPMLVPSSPSSVHAFDAPEQPYIQAAISPIMFKHAEQFSRYFTRKYGFLQFQVEHLNRRSRTLNRYTTSSTIYPDLPYLVFYKAFDGGVIFADLKYEMPEFVVSFHMYEKAKWTSADYYMIEQMSALYRKESEEIHLAANQLKLQDSVCFMTFNFDYHLRAVAQFLDAKCKDKPCIFGRNMNAFHVIERLLDFYQLDLILSKNLVAMKYLHMTKEQSDAHLARLAKPQESGEKEVHIRMECDPTSLNRYAGTPLVDAICKITESHLYKTETPVTIIEMTSILGESSKLRSRVVPSIKMQVHMDDIGDGELWPSTDAQRFVTEFEGKQRRRLIENLSNYGADNIPTPWEDSCVRRTVREMLKE